MSLGLALPLTLDADCYRKHVVVNGLEHHILILPRDSRNAKEIFTNCEHTFLSAVVEHSCLPGWGGSLWELRILGRIHGETGVRTTCDYLSRLIWHWWRGEERKSSGQPDLPG